MLAYSYLRFSSTEQAKGDSIRRQMVLRDDYLKRKNLSLDSSFVIPADKGASAFKGKHRQTGNLSLFLDAVKGGRVKKGALLLIENLDRLSREDAGQQLDLFRDILNNGITIVTLSPELEFRPGEMDFGKWVMALAEMCRGHSESQIKSSRGKANWENKRGKVNDGPITARRPSWLDLVGVKGKYTFKVNKPKAKIVQRIFKMAAEGHGIGSIARTLNAEGVKPISKSPYWHDSYVYKVLVNPAVKGIFQPNKRDEQGTLQPIGEPVKKYFPAIITEAEFAKAQVAIRSRRVSGGRNTKQISNLFTTIIHTEQGTGYAVRTLNHHQYLVANVVRAGLEEVKELASIPYPIFESVLLTWLRELKLNFGDDNMAADLEAQKAELQNRMNDIEAGIRKGGKATARLVALLEEAETELADVEERLQLAQIPRANQFSHARQLIGLLADADGDEKVTLRRQVKQQIKFLVRKITIRSEGKPRQPCKRHFLTIEFHDGQTRRIWFETARKGLVAHGLWTEAGKGMPAADFDDLFQQYIETNGPIDMTGVEERMKRNDELVAELVAAYHQQEAAAK